MWFLFRLDVNLVTIVGARARQFILEPKHFPNFHLEGVFRLVDQFIKAGLHRLGCEERGLLLLQLLFLFFNASSVKDYRFILFLQVLLGFGVEPLSFIKIPTDDSLGHFFSLGLFFWGFWLVRKEGGLSLLLILVDI